MRKIRNPLCGLAAFLAVVASTAGVRADFNATVAGLVLNNTIPDVDFNTVIMFNGLSTTDVLTTASTDTTTGFTQTLMGTYAGKALSVTYTGDSSAFPGGPITWTSTGSYGADTWTGSGSAQFTFPTSSTFQVAYSSSLTIGSNTVLTNTTISGSDDGTFLSYSGTTGTQTVNGAEMPVPYFDTLLVPKNPKKGDKDFDDIDLNNGKVRIVSDTTIEDVKPGPPTPPTMIADSGTLRAVPEPSSLALAGLGLLGLIGYAGWRGQRVVPIAQRRES